MPAGVAKRPCLGAAGKPCPDRAKIRGASRCPACSSEHERARTEARKDSEPWRVLYGLAEWKQARADRLERDRRRCVDCGSRQGLSVDHEIPLRELWAAYAYDVFVEVACLAVNLRTRCASCHSTIEALRRRAEA